MKIFPISDVHSGLFNPRQSYWRREFSFLDDVDVMCFAGDGNESISNIVLLTQILLEFPKLHIVYVPGNHDYYNSNIDYAMIEYTWADYAIDRLHLLTGNNYSTWEYGDFLFIGATLWTDFNGNNDRVANAVKRYMNDYKSIRSGKDGKLISVNRILEEHYKHKKMIFKKLEKNTDKRCIVVTHHKPYLSDCIVEAEIYGYEVDLTDKFNECSHLPEVWIYGHTHKSTWKEIEFAAGKVLFVSNQFGYAHEDISLTGFHKDCIIEV